MAEKITLQDHQMERQIVLSRIIIGGILSFLLILALFARVFYLQVNQHDYYSTQSDYYRISVQSIVPTRGLIYDRNGVLLAENIPSFTLSLVREHAGDIDSAIDIMGSLITLTEEDVEKFRSRLKNRSVPFSSVPVRYNLNEDEIAKISVNQFRLPGVSIDAELVRHYPGDENFSHSVGYLSSITESELKAVDPVNYSGTHQIGKMGLERFYEDILHGQVGYQTVEKNVHGQIMKVLESTDPISGQDIILHLDSNLQKAAVDALGDFRGAVVAIEPETGGILALVSKPAFNPNLFVQGISQKDYAALNDPVLSPLFNRALAKYAPGSTVKPFISLAALNGGFRTPEDTVHDPGFYQLGDHKHYDWTWWSNNTGHGMVDMQRAIYQSCNVYFWDLAMDMGIDPMHDFLFRFGFGRNVSLDLPQASTGTLPSRDWKLNTLGESWYPGETINSYVGQGYTEATPLQLATATMLMSNRGKWHRPALLKQTGLDSSPVKQSNFLPDIEINNPDYWDFIAESMEMVVSRGYEGEYRTSGSAYDYFAGKKPLKYRLAGKSGTAQVIAIPDDYDRADEVPEKYREHAWFISFAPIENPKIALAVFIEHGESGSRVAGPIARQILDTYLLDEEGELKDEYLFPQISEEAGQLESELRTKDTVVGSSVENINSLLEEERQLAILND
ncbi:MAG: penicillin-binding protein 2 [Gammaproteobacteria bacterium]|nr:penicillin-binding protein 2 [Gammaproteobacteria bacterium]